MAGLNTGLNPELVKVSLDKVVYGQFDDKASPDQTDALDSVFFKQDSTQLGAVSSVEYQPPSYFDIHLEEEEKVENEVRTGTKTTTDVDEYATSVPIPETFFEDAQHNIIPHTIRELGRKAKDTRNKYAFKYSYADAFSGVTTPDGAALISDSHVGLDGSTIDNLETGTLTPANFDVLIQSLELQKDQNGELGGHAVAGLLVPRVLYKTAFEVVESIQAAHTAENQLNIFNTKYGTMRMACSQWLDEDYNTYNSNGDTSYFVVSKYHHITRYQRLGLLTEIVPPKYDNRGRWYYRLRFRERVIAETWEGTAGSNGTA